MTKPSEALNINIRAAFGDDVYDTSPTGGGTDITADVREWEISRGRSSPLQDYNAGTISLTIDDTDGDYDPLNGGGAHGADLVENLHFWITADPNSSVLELGHAFYDDASLDYLDPGTAEIKMSGSDLLKLVGLWDGTRSGGWPAGLTGTRVGDVLDEIGVPSAWQDIDPGVHEMIARAAGVSVNGLEELKTVRTHEAPWAAVFATRDNKIRFDDSSAVAINTRITDRQATISRLPADSATSIAPRRMPFGSRDSLIRTVAEITLADGTIVTATAASGTIDRYGRPTWAETLDQIVTTTNDAQGICDAVIVMFGQARWGPKQAEINILNAGSQAAALLALELGDRVRVKHTAPAGHSIDVDAFVQGITIRGDRSGAVIMVLSITPAGITDSLNPDLWLIWDTGSWDTNKWGYVA